MESNKIDSEGPPPPLNWRDLPGETVMLYEHSAEQAGLHVNLYGTEFQVKKLKPGVHFEANSYDEDLTRFEASTPYRACVYQGASQEEALGAMLTGWGLLCRDGSINPNAPAQPGSPIIQHTIAVLTERLSWVVEQRQHHLVMSGYMSNPESIAKPIITAADLLGPSTDAASEQMQRAVARDNEIISALATAIASLARVKDL